VNFPGKEGKKGSRGRDCNQREVIMIEKGGKSTTSPRLHEKGGALKKPFLLGKRGRKEGALRGKVREEGGSKYLKKKIKKGKKSGLYKKRPHLQKGKGGGRKKKNPAVGKKTPPPGRGPFRPRHPRERNPTPPFHRLETGPSSKKNKEKMPPCDDTRQGKRTTRPPRKVLCEHWAAVQRPLTDQRHLSRKAGRGNTASFLVHKGKKKRT